MNQPSFFIRIFRQPPVLFPLVLVFHLVVLVLAVKPYVLEGGLASPAGMIALAWSLAYLVLWLFICDLRKWAATAYMIFAAVNLLLQYVFRTTPLWHDAGETLFPFDLLMTVFLLFYYKRFH